MRLPLDTVCDTCHMARYIVQVAFQPKDALPRDQMENVWHFSTAGAVDVSADSADITTKISNFYLVAGGTGIPSVSSFYSPTLSEAVTCKFYDEDSALHPRIQLALTTFAITVGAAPGLPEEVALCMSYYASQNVPRKRGRLYLGPFARPLDDTEDTSDTPSASRPDPALLTSVCDAGKALVDASSTGAKWCQRSGIGTGTLGAPVVIYSPVTNGWCDNEWDSQRRRRITATSRTVFSATAVD